MAAAVLFGAAAGVALLQFLGNKDKGTKLSIVNNVTTDMVVAANFDSALDCISKVTGSQSINLQSSGEYLPARKLREAGSSCLLCAEALRDIRLARQSLETDALRLNSTYEPQQPSNLVSAAMLGGPPEPAVNPIGACDLMCNDIVVNNVTQSQLFEAQTDCVVDTEVNNDIQQSLSAAVNAKLENKQDVLGQLSDAFISNSPSVVNNLVSRLNTTVNTQVAQSLLNQARNNQEFNLGIQNSNGSSHSVFVNNATQTFSSKSIAKLSVSNQVVNSLKQSADFSIAQQLLNKNDSIGDISGAFVQVIDTMADLLPTIVGSLLLILGGVLAVAIMFAGSMYFLNPKFKAAVDRVVDQKIGPTTYH